jgi:hypothetical protein
VASIADLGADGKRRHHLNRGEREVVLGAADDEPKWHVYTDSTRLTRKLLAIAARWGVTPEQMGAGFQFTLPLQAVRFVGPQRVTDRQYANLRHAGSAGRRTRNPADGAEVQKPPRSSAFLQRSGAPSEGPKP